MLRSLIIYFTAVLVFSGCFNIVILSPVTIRVELQTTPLDTDEHIFMSGNLPQLGGWSATGLPFSQISDTKWIAEFKVKTGSSIEFKITRGSWNLEAMTEKCIVPGNSALIANQDTTIIIEIPRWKDDCAAAGGGITGEVRYHEDFASQHLTLPRDIIVWLPPGYTEDERYPVLYMHDGQNIFDPLTSYIGQDWKVDEVATQLISENKMKKIIVVGIYCTELRGPEYSPMQLGEKYTQFLIQELKPFIDSHYPTLRDSSNTAVMGSSMGGIISFNIAWENPHVFSMAGCLSPAFMVDDNEILERVNTYTGNKKPIKFYLDNGTVGLEAELAPGFEQMCRLLPQKGYTEDDLLVYVDDGAVHNEIAWANRIHIPLLFFFGTE